MDNIEKMAKNYVAILEQLKKHQIPEAYPEADRYPFLFGEKSLDEGSLFVREEVIRLCGYCYLSYNWIRPWSCQFTLPISWAANINRRKINPNSPNKFIS